MAYLSRIFVYPVKALDAVSLDTARVLPTGALADDRRFAILDAMGKYVNGKRHARVHLLRSTYNPATRVLKLSAGADMEPAGFDVDADRPALEAWLTEFFGFPVTFRENIDAGFPDDTDSPGPTLVSTATLREIAAWFGLTLEQTRARFRTNLEVDGVPPFWEDQLYGLRGTTVRFSIGGVLFDGINPCQRCVVPGRDPKTGIDLPDFAKRFVELRRKYLPEWAESSRFNHFFRLAINTRLVGSEPGLELKTGDRVQVIGPIGVAVDPAAIAAASAGPKRWSGRLRVARVCQNTPAVRTFRLASMDGGKLPFTYLPGQHLNIELKIDGVLHRRCYTIASTPTRPEFCELTVKREEKGTVSRYLHDHLREGMTLDVSGPGGRFTFTGEEARSLLLIGGGVGITPLMSVIRYLTDRKWSGEIDFIYCAKTERELIFGQELRSLAEVHPNLRVTTTLTKEPSSHWRGLRGRLTAELLRRSVPDLTGRRVHICGPVEMADDVTRMLREAGVPDQEIRSEAFGGAMPAPSSAAVAEKPGKIIGSVTFADSGKSVPLHCGQTVLEAATLAGISIDRGCMAGICGRCRVRLLSGDVNMAVDEVLSADERRSGMILACQAKPSGSVVIDA
jgi:ferredoxin-NADP reductase/uncharacterized protein YcbX